MKRLGKLLLLLVTAALLVTGYRVWRDWGLPEELIELRERYPETADFVADYRKEHDVEHVIDLSGEVEQGKMPLLLQWDKRWGYETYGSSMMAITGCGPTCLSMVLCGLTGDPQWDPLTVAAFSEGAGYYVPGAGTAWALMTDGAARLGIHGEAGAVSEDYLREKLAAGTPLICSMWPGDFTTSGHFILLTGLDEAGRVVLNDPNSPKNSEKAWDMAELLPQIRAVWQFWL